MPMQPPTLPPTKAAANKAEAGPQLSIQTHKVLAERLGALTGGAFPRMDDIRDAFYAAGLEPPKVETPAAGTPQVEAATLCKPRKDVFAQGHVLRAVMVGPGGRMALMDNTCLKIGQKVEEFELIEVGERNATFASASGEKVTFSLPDKTNGQ